MQQYECIYVVKDLESCKLKMEYSSLVDSLEKCDVACYMAGYIYIYIGIVRERMLNQVQ